ncbi:MAG: potassium transporter KefB, partial [Nitrospirae bacterium]|nr:potassium transporter KefB [Nitrospirota bacterium]
SPEPFPGLKLHIPGVEVSAMKVEEESPLVGKTLAQTDLRRKFGITVVAIRRDSRILANPDGDMQVRAGDVLLVLGPPEKIAAVTGMFYRCE